MKKIVVIGPESTGKSTLSAALAVELGTLWVPEYAREYLERLDRPYEQNDLIEIAKGQVKLEDELAAKVSGTLICDTDLNVIKVWSEAKYNACNRYITEQIAERKYDLYLLTYIDTEWEDDPLREHPAPEERTYFYNIYRDIVQNNNVPWMDIRGPHEERLKSAMDAVRQIIL
ncbi:MAG: ATP-binding protein [Chitinophagaceae bacterium]|nr:ATP-binding protein [Chitinophagaceae bacterium]